MDISQERVFQDDIIAHLTASGWLLGEAKHYDRERAIYPEDVLGFVRETQPEQWEKFCKQYPQDSERALLDSVVRQLAMADPNATTPEMRKYGTLGVLRHEFKDRGARLRLCQFKPDHELNPDTLAKYGKNRLRVVPELTYSPYATEEHMAATGKKAKPWRIDLVLFVNGLPVATLELKSEFKQSVENAKRQYMKTRLPKDPATNKPEPLLTFKRGALVHFAVSQYEVYMTTKLAGTDTFFLPFNKGTSEGGAGNDTPKEGYATAYLWEEVLQPDNLLRILGRFVHLQVEEKEDWEGRKYNKESLIFPRYHQWDVVNRLIDAARVEGPGERYLVQHSAGSGKSNSIAWTGHQLASLYDANGEKQFHSVIVVTDRTVLDAQLQDTIYQFEHADGVVGRINREEGQGSKSEKLANALEAAQPIIIVTIQTFPHVIEAIRSRTTLKGRNYAIIADEAHSSQTGSTARKLREVLLVEQVDENEELTTEDLLDYALEARKGSENISYFAFTATPKSRTLELFGRLPNPELPASADNLPQAFHVYTMRQAIEEGFILDVLKNYTTYKSAYQLAHANPQLDEEVDSKRAAIKVNQWVKLHPHNISQKVRVIVEHFREHVMHLLGGQAKAMVVTSSRKEAVRYKLAFDKYVTEQGYGKIKAMVAFSGEVVDTESGPDPFTESNMNPGLKGRDMRAAFDSDDYQVMLVANKFQTGFDQPKLVAMYVDKKLAGVECVQTLSRLNRMYDGKKECGTFVLDFFNDPQDVLDAFQPYYQTAELADVTDPNLIHDLFNKLTAETIFQWHEVEAFTEAFFSNPKTKGNAALSNICKPAVERWQKRYKLAVDAFREAKDIFERAEKSGDAVLIANSEKSFKECKEEKDRLDIFKKDLGSFVRFYEFMSQIVEYDDKDLEKLSLYARHLRPMLREQLDEEEIDLSSVVMTHYRLSKIREQNLKLQEDAEGYELEPGTGLGAAKPRDKEIDLLSHILERMNELFVTDELTDGDKLHYAQTIADKLRENSAVMQQLENNTPEQAMLGDYPKAVEQAVMDSMDVHENMAMQYLASKEIQEGFAKMLLSLVMQKT